MNLLNNLLKKTNIDFRKKEYLGIDIGTASIKMVEITEGKKVPKLVNYGTLETKGHLDRINEAIQTSSLEIVSGETSQVLQTLIDQVRPKARDVIASIPSFSAFTALIDVPDMQDSETAQAMQYQAQSIVPLPLNKVTLDWTTVSKYKDSDGNSKQQVLLVAVANSLIEKYQKIFTDVGLNLIALELEGISLARVLTQGDPTLSLIIDIGARSTAILIGQNGFLKHSSQADYAGTSFTQAISRGLGINLERAEALKRQKGLRGSGGEYEVSTLMIPYLDSILDETIRVKNNFEANYAAKVERVILSGGSANLAGIEEYVSSKLAIPAVKGEPFASGIDYPQQISPAIAQLGPFLAVSLGLGLRQFTGKGK
ncbi:MAG: hypothetical protein COT88_00325 [Candidatus Colwellbacteria bacterium CG10_big_fil_rev_8_21_14_0_10_41_28]|uniref:SHS2 domain-containing protein n=1 Tax=Candidatus Colwellbacteria bacterium CG10_big_fil_rev_8_21_14_0_10_41_28 TaxID=1974539 RepID=A0A2H0VHT4_9BACT|nr:MAG: hypothetical protein COT88_00325 [Candidatus Colwellbacteria bacterium CG10_big_fil_rev_8_21_14_0_10_41_28]